MWEIRLEEAAAWDRRRMRRLAIYGTGGFGREVAPLVRVMLESEHGAAEGDGLVFVSDIETQIGRVVNGIPVISFDALISPMHRTREVIVALADWRTRRQIDTRCKDHGLRFASLAAHSHRSYDDVSVGEGAIFCEHTICTSNVRIGRHFHCNIYSYVAHDCVVGDFVTFAPRVSCNGRVVIEDDVYIGTGVVIRDGKADRPLTIGKGAIVGMGSVVTKDVPPGAVVIGSPAKPRPA
jgi:sugar O-acyltransferase (sialic acid O-acetyltransferase NeuD family)